MQPRNAKPTVSLHMVTGTIPAYLRGYLAGKTGVKVGKRRMFVMPEEVILLADDPSPEAAALRLRELPRSVNRQECRSQPGSSD